MEPRIGLLKSGLSIRRVLRRGLEAVRTECVPLCTVVNLGILLRHGEQVTSMR